MPGSGSSAPAQVSRHCFHCCPELPSGGWRGAEAAPDVSPRCHKASHRQTAAHMPWPPRRLLRAEGPGEMLHAEPRGLTKQRQASSTARRACLGHGEIFLHSLHPTGASIWAVPVGARHPLLLPLLLPCSVPWWLRSAALSGQGDEPDGDLNRAGACRG